MRLPTQLMAQVLPRLMESVVRFKTPSVMNIVWPVNSSDPAKMTKVSAMPKLVPMTRLRQDGSAACPSPKIRIMPTPT